MMLPLKGVAQPMGLGDHGDILGQEAPLEFLRCPQGLTQWLVPSRATNICLGWRVAPLGKAAILTAAGTRFYSLIEHLLST